MNHEQNFIKFDEKNPHIYALFVKLAFEAFDRGKKRISSKQIIGGIRWNSYIHTDSDDEYKINDAYTAHYGRKFVKDFPEHFDKFEFRELRNNSEVLVDKFGQIQLI